MHTDGRTQADRNTTVPLHAVSNHTIIIGTLVLMLIAGIIDTYFLARSKTPGERITWVALHLAVGYTQLACLIHFGAITHYSELVYGTGIAAGARLLQVMLVAYFDLRPATPEEFRLFMLVVYNLAVSIALIVLYLSASKITHGFIIG